MKLEYVLLGMALAIASVVAGDVLWVSQAQAAGFDGIATAINNISTGLSGTPARAVATLCVVVVGYMWMAGQMDPMRCFSIVGGICLVLGGAGLVTLVFGS